MSIRVVLTEADFCELVRGRTVTKKDLNNPGTIMIILEDIGFRNMAFAVHKALEEVQTKEAKDRESET